MLKLETLPPTLPQPLVNQFTEPTKVHCPVPFQWCQMAKFIAKFGQNWRNWDPFGYKKLFLAISYFWLKTD